MYLILAGPKHCTKSVHECWQLYLHGLSFFSPLQNHIESLINSAAFRAAAAAVRFGERRARAAASASHFVGGHARAAAAAGLCVGACVRAAAAAAAFAEEHIGAAAKHYVLPDGISAPLRRQQSSVEGVATPQ